MFAPGLNTLVGPNGSGKSTIIKALLDGSDCDLEFVGTDQRRLFDTELMNPRVARGAAGTPQAMASIKDMPNPSCFDKRMK